jgi:hypothetical protein
MEVILIPDPPLLTKGFLWISNDLGIRFTVYYDGNKSDFDKQINKSIVHKELADLFQRRTMTEKSTRFLNESLEGQWKEETQKAYRESSLGVFTAPSDCICQFP